MPTFQNTFVYKVIDEISKTATFGTGAKINGNGFVQRTNISGVVTIPPIMDGYTIISLSYYSLRQCNLITELILPNTLTTLEVASLTWLELITHIVFPASIEVFKDSIDYLFNATQIIFEPNSKLKYVGNNFLRHCFKLEVLVLPPSLKYIGLNNCFTNDYALRIIIYLGEGDFQNVLPFVNCSSDIRIYVSRSYPSQMFSDRKVLQFFDFNCKTVNHYSNFFSLRNIVLYSVFILV